MKKLIILLILLSLISCDYSEGLYLPDIGESDESVPSVPAEGLNAYRKADAEAHIVPDKIIERIPELSDLDLIKNTVYSVPAVIKDGFLNTVLSSLGVDLDGFFVRENIRPSARSVSFDASLHIDDEGVNIFNGNTTPLYTAKVDYIDLVASAGCGNLGRFIFRLIDRNEWPYTQTASGRLGISAYIDLAPSEAGSYESLTFSAYADAELDNVYFNYVVVNGSRIYIPANGTARFAADISLASSLFTYADVDDSVEGYPMLDGSEEITYTNYYCPYEISISVKPTLEFSCSSAFSILTNLLKNYNSQSRDIYWNQLTELVWGSAGGEYITFELRIPDQGDGSERVIRLHDFEILNYLLPS